MDETNAKKNKNKFIKIIIKLIKNKIILLILKSNFLLILKINKKLNTGKNRKK